MFEPTSRRWRTTVISPPIADTSAYTFGFGGAWPKAGAAAQSAAATRASTRFMSPIRAQDPRRLGLRVLHRLLRRLRAGERRLDAVVQGLGHALVVVRREL